jgi:cobalamin biosynthesis Mg chelatase CobN
LKVKNQFQFHLKGKQFYSIITADGQQYFLVIDMTAAQSKSTDTENTAFAGEGSVNKNNNPNNGTVYFLTSVSNQNLLNFTNDGEKTLPHNSVATANGIDPYTMTPIAKGTDTKEKVVENATESDAEEIKKEDKGESGSGMLMYIIIFGVVAVVIVGYKLMTAKKGKPEQSDDSMYGEDDDVEEEPVPLSELDEREE